MKSILYLFCFVFLAACSSDSVEKNPYLPNYSFNTGSLINTNLPEYSQLKFAANSIILNSPYGINGVVVYYAGGDNYNAFELTDPNHQISACSTMSVNGLIATCDCDDGNSYDLLNGIRREGTTGTYPLIRYRVEVSGSLIRVYNN
ncbi:hypothetical protein ACFFU1_00460 [Algibacter miyuki]|uniref:Rieske domain-containing protein n=1 Tax=Algibacter miyuki TaxID=1306933 RepID=A0ABV5GUP5_9FLAO|nr:hypothetical protein [Algibacter miyuki]MDN3664681.1 hypothetical protein [Algibacter miyuki]